jgi:DNA-binding response OmpR family regulator
MKLLIIEDDPLIRISLVEMLTHWGYVCDQASDGKEGLELALSFHYHLILLDLNLPHLDGLSLCRRLRRSGGDQPLILMLTARSSKADKLLGFQEGADDYISKPFDPDVLRVRVRALLRRVDRPHTEGWQWGALHLEADGHGASYRGQDLKLTAKEHHILEALILARGRTCAKQGLLGSAWSWSETAGEASLKTHIKNLRAKLCAAAAPADLVETVYGVGFRLNSDHIA